jgi:hypothetical protein
MLEDPTGGLGFLGEIDGLFIQQKLELFEAITGCNTINRYNVTPIPAHSLPDPVSPEWINHFKVRGTRASGDVQRAHVALYNTQLAGCLAWALTAPCGRWIEDAECRMCRAVYRVQGA